MKTQLLAALAIITSQLEIIAAGIYGLPDDPIPAPTGFRVLSQYGGIDSPLSVDLAWDDMQGFVPVLEYIGAPGNPAGPQGWTPFSANAQVTPEGVGATFTLQNPSGQSIVFRLRWMNASTGQLSEPTELAFPVFA